MPASGQQRGQVGRWQYMDGGGGLVLVYSGKNMDEKEMMDIGIETFED